MRLLSSSLPTSSSSSPWFFISVLALILCHCCLAHKNSTSDILCIERERVALVDFKHGLVDHANRLVSWDSTEEGDCCRWTGIVCDFTGNVREIHLRGPRKPRNLLESLVHFNFESLRLSGKISPSLLVLKKLEYLELSNNDFLGIQIPKFIGSLCNLRYLNLSCSNFSGEIPPQLGNLTRLHALGLSDYDDDGVTNYDDFSLYGGLKSNLDWLSHLSRLQNLDMSFVDLSKASKWLQTINSLPSLVELRMRSCGLRNSSLDPPIFSDNPSSLFLLDLSDNPHLSGILLHFHNMTSLRKLYVSRFPFMNMSTVLRRLSSVGSGLSTLDISYGHISSSTISHLRNMTSLVVLDLSNNQLTKGISKSLGNLCNLRELSLSGNNFSEINLLEIVNTFLDCNSSKLESLEIAASNVSGHLPERIGNLHNLVNLNLAGNLLSGPIPYSIGNLSSLRRLVLYDNQLNGNLPPSIGQLYQLETMSLPDNMFSGIVTEDHFANLTNLNVLFADRNHLTLKLHSANWVPRFQLQILTLNFWNLESQFPLWLQSQTKLLYLDISSTKISGILPDSFLTRLSDLRAVYMSFNHINGSISKIPAKVLDLDLSSNNFGGPLPKLSNNSRLEYLDLSSNSFIGSLKTFLCGKMVPPHPQYYLNVSNNNLSGVIPQCWENWKGLQILDLENNNLSGEIPSCLGYLSELQYLNMRNNKLVGRLPVSLMHLTSLKILQLSQNKLMGSIPPWIGSQLTELKILDLRSNMFSANISYELCHLISLQVLDLAHNDLSGDIPACFNNFGGMSGLEVLSSNILPEKLQLKHICAAMLAMRGREDRYGSTLGLATMLDLSNNQFSGPIPDELMNLKALLSMSLSGNQLTGKIPNKIGDLKQIEFLDLSLNQLQGEISMSLSDLNSLSHLNLSYNNLTGRIPTSTQILGLDNSSFIGNRLCGPPLTEVCVVEIHDHHDGRGMKLGSNRTHATDWGCIISILLGFALGFWIILGPLYLNRSWRIKYFLILYNVWYKIHDVICR